MTTAEFGYCPAHGMVGTKYNFSVGVLAVLIFFALFGIGVIFLLIYAVYVMTAKDRVCTICGGQVYPAPMPVPMPYYQPVYPTSYYQYPPYYPPPR